MMVKDVDELLTSLIGHMEEEIKTLQKVLSGLKDVKEGRVKEWKKGD